jgi:hypothetical protein
MPEITPNTKIHFGFTFRGKRVRDLSDSDLQWFIKHADTDPAAAYIPAVLEVIAGRAANLKEFAQEDDLEKQADEILKNAGAGDLCRRPRR